MAASATSSAAVPAEEELLFEIGGCDIQRNGSSLYADAQLSVVSRGAARALRVGAVAYPLLPHNSVTVSTATDGVATFLLPVPGGEDIGDPGYLVRVPGASDAQALEDVLSSLIRIEHAEPAARGAVNHGHTAGPAAAVALGAAAGGSAAVASTTPYPSTSPYPVAAVDPGPAPAQLDADDVSVSVLRPEDDDDDDDDVAVGGNSAPLYGETFTEKLKNKGRSVGAAVREKAPVVKESIKKGAKDTKETATRYYGTVSTTVTNTVQDASNTAAGAVREIRSRNNLSRDIAATDGCGLNPTQRSFCVFAGAGFATGGAFLGASMAPSKSKGKDGEDNSVVWVLILALAWISAACATFLLISLPRQLKYLKSPFRACALGFWFVAFGAAIVVGFSNVGPAGVMLATFIQAIAYWCYTLSFMPMARRLCKSLV